MTARPPASALTTLPCSDWSSNRPSPVMTRSAAATSAARPVCSAMTAAPDSRRPPSASSAAPMPPAAPAPGSSLTSRPAAAFSSAAQSRQPGFQQRDGGRVGALLRAEHGGRAHRAEQRVFDVGRGDQLDACQPAPGRPSARRARRPCRGRRRCSALPPSPTTMRPAPASQRGGDELADSPAVRRRARSGRSAGRRAAPARRPARTRRRPWPARSGRAPTRRSTSSVSGPLTGRRVQPAEPTGQHADEAGAAVGLRRKGQRVVGAGRSPARRDGLGGLDRGQAVAEAVGRDQHTQCRPVMPADVMPARAVHARRDDRPRDEK